MRNREKRGCKANKAAVGLLILLAGSVLLLRQMGYLLEPAWLFSWPMIPVIVGIFSGIATRFRDLSWLILIGIGFFFLIDDIVPGISIRQYIWPAIIIAVGLIVIFWPRNKTHLGWGKDEHAGQGRFVFHHEFGVGDTVTKNSGSVEDLSTGSMTSKDQEEEKNISLEEEVLNVTAIFGGIKKNVVSKAFKGGEIVSVFGGSEINLSQADFKQRIEIEAVQIFGGTTLVVPPNWQIRSESVAVFGGIDDKRERMSDTPDKVLVLKGFTLFGGIELKSY